MDKGRKEQGNKDKEKHSCGNKDRWLGYCQLACRAQFTAEFQRRKVPQDSEILGKIDRYAAFLTSVTSFHCRNRSCKRVRYSPARKRCLRGWKCPAMGPKAERKRWACFADAEPPHLLFTQSRGLVGVFRSIVQSFVLPILHPRQDLAFGGSIALQFIGDDHAGDIVQSFEELPKKAFRRVCVASALHQDIQHVAVLINGSPEIMRFPIVE